MSKFKPSYSDFAITLTIFIFWLVKLSTLSVRFGDGNVYIYAANQLLTGLMPYRDFFVVVPPFLIYFLSLFALIFQKQLILYSLIPLICETFSAIFIYLILKRVKYSLAPLSAIFYLFSFTILSTTDYLSGIAIVNFLITLALLFLSTNKLFFSGVLFGLALMTKFYALPVIIGVTFLLLYRRQIRQLIPFLLGVCLTSVFIAVPYILFAPIPAFRDLIIHQLHRPAGLNKLDVLTFFFTKEIVLIFFTLAAIFIQDKSKYLFIIPLITLAIFFLFFSDIYYLYLASLLPFLAILTVIFLSKLWALSPRYRQLFMVALPLFAVFMIYQTMDYLSQTAPLGQWQNSTEVSQFLQSLPKNYPLYGNHDIAPALALLSRRPLYQNIYETNPQGFRSGLNNRDAISRQSVEQGIYLVARTINNPNIKTDQIGFEEYFSRSVFDKYCTKLKDFSSIEIEIYNQISIYECKN